MTIVAVQHCRSVRFYAALHNMSQPADWCLRIVCVAPAAGEPATKNPAADGMHF